MYLIITLGIILVSSTSSQAQNTQLSLISETELSQSLSDSLGLPVIVRENTNIVNAVDSLHRKLEQFGFIDAEYVKTEKTSDSSYEAHFRLNKRFTTLQIDYAEAGFSKKEIEFIINTNQINDSTFHISTSNTTETLHRLTALLGRKGQPFARIALKEIQKTEAGRLLATLSITNTAPRRIDSIVLRGYEKFPRAFLKYHVGIKKGQLFNQDKLLKQNQQIDNLGFATTTKPPEALFRTDSTLVYLYPQKKNYNHFDGVLGFSTDEETQKFIFNGHLDLRLNNNLNYGESFAIDYRADGKEQVEFRTQLGIPFLFNTRFGIDARLRIFKKDSSFVTNQRQIRTTYQISPRAKAHIGYRSHNSTNLLDQPIPGISIEDFKTGSVIFGGQFTRIQSSDLFPEQTKLSLEAGISRRKQLREQESQWTLEGSAHHIVNLSWRTSIFVANTTEIMKSETYFVNELFRFGGINSIRGFAENSLEASFYSVLNTEFRFRLNPEIFVHSIIDLGYFENPLLDQKTTLNSLGFGLGINTKGGFFRLNFANGRASGQKFDFSSSKVHISITTQF